MDQFTYSTIAKGENPSKLNDIKQPTDEDFDGYPYIIWDHRTGEVTRRLTQEEYDNSFIRNVSFTIINPFHQRNSK